MVRCGGQGKTLAACLQDVARPQGRREGLCVPGSMSMGVSSLNRLFFTDLYCLSGFVDVSESQGPGAILRSFSLNCSSNVPTLELLRVQPPTTFFNPPSLTRWQGIYVGKVGSWAQLGTVGEGQTLNSQSQRWCESDRVSRSVMSDSATPWTVACQAPLSMEFLSSCPGKSTGVGCHSLLQGSSQPRDRTWISCTTGRFSTV